MCKDRVVGETAIPCKAAPASRPVKMTIEKMLNR